MKHQARATQGHVQQDPYVQELVMYQATITRRRDIIDAIGKVRETRHTQYLMDTKDVFFGEELLDYA
jgi:hypothetical protein